ncbi:SusC/RagA family TonB-linked outer membrane protein [Ekhidna sp.]
MKNLHLRVLVMSGKLSIYLIVLKAFFFTSLLATETKGQSKSVHEVNITINLQESSIKSVLDYIENVSEYNFHYYSNDLTDEVKMTLRSSEISVGDVLLQISKKSDLKFRQINNSIAVAKKRRRNDNSIEVLLKDVDVSGVVRDDTGEGLPGVTVQEKGTTNGVITDIDGRFKVSVADDAILVFSYLGFESEEIAINGQTVLDVTMLPDITALSEVVVLAYGETERKRLTESIAIVDAKDIESVPLASFDNILQGAAPGVQVAAAGGQPGSGVNVRIRGISSITGGLNPLYIIDGVAVNQGNLTEDAQTGNGFASINPADIENITILKDASATSLYGSRATNGVVLITTKKGRSGKTKVKLSAQYGFSEFENPNNFGVMNSQEFIGYMREAVVNGGGNPNQQFINAGADLNPDYFPLGDTISTDWAGNAIRQAKIRRYDVSASGGTDKAQFFTSLGYYDEEGIVTNTNFQRLSARFNLNHNISERAAVGINFSVSETTQTNRQGAGTTFRDPIYGSFFLSPLYPIFANSEQIANGEDYGTGFNFNTPGFAGHNTIASNQLNTNEVQTFRSIGNIYATFDITPEIQVKSSFGFDRADVKEDEFVSFRYELGRSGGSDVDGSSIAHNIREIDWTFTNTINFDKDLNSDHSISALAGNELFKSVTDRNRTFGLLVIDKLKTNNSALPENQQIDTDFTSWTLASFFGKVNYSFKDKYFLNVSGRADGSSRFGPNDRWGAFWAVGGGYVISEEPFMQNIGAIDFLKIRAGVGTQGNNSIGNFNWLRSYNFGGGLSFNGVSGAGSRPDDIGNPNIRWESQFTTDVGIDVSLLNRFNLEATYYNKDITSLLDNRPLSRTTGFNTQIVNDGELRNYGYEFSITSVNLKAGDFTWTTNFQYSRNFNEVVNIGDESGERADPDDQETVREGSRADAWYMPRWAGVDPATGKPLWFDENDNITDSYGNANFAIVGQQLPDFFGSFSNTFSYKGISLTANFYYSYGNQVYREVQRFLSSDGSRFGRNQDRLQLNRWQKPGDITDVPRISKGNADGGNNHSTRYLEDGSFIKLRNVTVAYELPSGLISKWKLSRVRLYAQGLNLRTWTNFRGMDPETGSGSRDFGEYPNPRKVLFGIDIEF